MPGRRPVNRFARRKEQTIPIRTSWLRRAERGAAAVLVVVLLSCGSLLGLAALTVDVGQLYAEREELQSGADSAALAIAKACTLDPSGCAGQSAAIAQTYADRNAKDGTSTVTTICGRAYGLASCPAPVDGLGACQGTAPATANYVEVRTVTRRPDGSTLLPPTFAGAVMGSGYGGKQVHACARVAWGPPASADVYAMTISTCEWSSMTGDGMNLQAQPPATPPTSAESVIYLHGSSQTCPAGTSGWDAPGGFGWLDGSNCSTTVSANGTYGGDTGNGISWPCYNAMYQARVNHTVLLIPIYDGVTGNGGSTTYHAVGLAAFVITGYNVTGAWAASWLTGQQWCSGNTKCVYGYFVGKYVLDNPSLTARGYGVMAIKTVG